MPNKRGVPYEYEMARAITESSRMKCVGENGCGYEGEDVEFHKRPNLAKCPRCGKTDTFLVVNPNQVKLAKLFSAKKGDVF